jgi:hypothetical protein
MYSDSDVSLNQIVSFMQLLIVGTCHLLSTSALGVASADFVQLPQHQLFSNLRTRLLVGLNFSFLRTLEL